MTTFQLADRIAKAKAEHGASDAAEWRRDVDKNTHTVQIFVNGFLYDTFKVLGADETNARKNALMQAFKQGFSPNGGLVSYTVNGHESKGNF